MSLWAGEAKGWPNYSKSNWLAPSIHPNQLEQKHSTTSRHATLTAHPASWSKRASVFIWKISLSHREQKLSFVD
jgi:hypothetical protein